MTQAAARRTRNITSRICVSVPCAFSGAMKSGEKGTSSALVPATPAAAAGGGGGEAEAGGGKKKKKKA